MRHRNKGNALGRTASHKKAMISNMACSLIEHKRITTTLAKAKELRTFVEPLITKSKTDSTHSRRVVFSNLKSKDAVSALFRDVAPKVADRPGGYTRIIKLGVRQGDAAEMCMIELVDFNELLLQDAKTKTRRSRRGGKKKSDAAPAAAANTDESTAKDAPEAAKAEAAPDTKEEASETATAELKQSQQEAEAGEQAAPEVKADDKPADDEEEKKDQ